jgi:iron only hydrogenase large subunit-like protein/uncharacterized Fe-S cluster-containing protein
MTHPVISTNLARCRDCYACVRNCPVKAVRVSAGQAQIVPALCIACAKCVRICPQKAKNVRDDRPIVRQELASRRPVVASVAPSAPAYFGITDFSQIDKALKQLGFTAAEETAFGAEMVGLAHRDAVARDNAVRPIVASSCPVVVNLVQQYYPDLIPHLAPIVSPMTAHGRWLRQVYGEDAFVVFIGPCVAKKGEISDVGVEDAVNAALTFDELEQWLAAEAIKIPEAPPAEPTTPRSAARLFPVEGGLVGTARMDTDILARDIIATSGMDACRDILASIRSGQLEARLVELMACEGGCINGPVMPTVGGAYLARQRVIEYATRRQPRALPTPDQRPNLVREFADHSVPMPTFSEEQIREVLRRVEKYSPEDELNCGACGYPSCRDKAIAALNGMAETTMCIPYMRRRADSIRQVLMEVTPNAVVIVDTRLHLQDMSPSAEAMFGQHLPAVQGLPLETLVSDISAFTRVRDTGQSILSETTRMSETLIVEQTIVPVQGQNIIVGIFRNVTERESQRQSLDRLRSETLHRTQEVVQNQMRIAHEIAQLLGEATADTKMMVSRLGKLLEEAPES